LARRWRCRRQAILSLIRSGQLAAFALPGKRQTFRITPETVAAFEMRKAAAAAPIPRRRTTKQNGIIEFF
jgi:hypothetical protein